MDLKKTEDIMTDLEKNARKIGEITASIEEFKKIITTLDQLPQNIEKKGSDYLQEIKDKHTTLSAELSKIQKDFEKLEKDIPVSIDKGIKKLTDVSKDFVDISKKISNLESSHQNKVNSLEKKIERELDLLKQDSKRDIAGIQNRIVWALVLLAIILLSQGFFLLGI